MGDDQAEGTLEYRGRVYPLGGRTLMVVLALLAMEAQIKAVDKCEVVFNCAGTVVKPKLTIYPPTGSPPRGGAERR